MATENKYVIRLNNTVSYELNEGLIEGVETSYPYPSTSGQYANTFNDISFDENNDALELLPALLEVPEYYDGHLTSNHLITAIVKDRSNYIRVAPIWLSYKWCFNVYNGLPIYKDNIGTEYSVADFNADKLAGTLPEHLYVSAYNEEYETVYIPYPISASYNIFEVSDVASDTPPTPPTPPVTTYNKPLIYNRDSDCIEKSLGNIEVVGDMKAASVTTPSLIVTQPVENLTVENLTVTDTASINHATIVTEEDVHSEADFIELRVGNPLPTPSTGSGFKVKNYDGNNNDLELVTDSNGTFRIGAENSLQSILTRDEEADLANGAPLVWNAAQHKAQTSATTDGNKVLKSVKNSTTGVVSYEWSSSGSGAVWRGTQAELTAALAITDPNDESYIPNNAMIIITDADNTYLLGEEQ